MEIIAKCPICKVAMRLSPEWADRRLRCLKCGNLIQVPDWEQLKNSLDALNDIDAPVYVDEDGNIYG